MLQEAPQAEVFDPPRWGLPPEAVADLAERLRRIWTRFRSCFQTQTRDSSSHAWVYLRGLLTMTQKRNFANIARRVIDPQADGQNLQQVISDSPWEGQAVFPQIQGEITARPELPGGMLTLDESGDQRAGPYSAGAARQSLGREGKVDLGQGGVAVGYSQAGGWAMVDADLYLPEVWFDPAHAPLRQRWHLPPQRRFATKPQLGLEMIRRAKAQGLPFAGVGCDSLYGRDGQFRADLAAEGLLSLADIPADPRVYLKEPGVGVPQTPPGHQGRPFSRRQRLTLDDPGEVRALGTPPDLRVQPVEVRSPERGRLSYPCAARRVWTISPQGQVRQEGLFIRREAEGTLSFSLSNAPADTPLTQLARWRSQRYFAERTFQDAKSEGGWDELVARKYRAWVHPTALDALALWFVAETKLDWAQAHPPDPGLADQVGVDILPGLSMANVRELLQAVLPLRQLSPEEATRWVVKHLVHRAQATGSRLKAQRRDRGPT